MKKMTDRERIAKRDEEENKNAKPKRFFVRRKTFVNPSVKTMKFSRFDTYEENKQDYYNVLDLVYSGKCKDIFEAYAKNH